jgi:hypothetical protein
LTTLWDFRDLANDQARVWDDFTAELLFQALAERVDGADGESIDWEAFTTLLAEALKVAASWAAPKSP